MLDFNFFHTINPDGTLNFKETYIITNRDFSYILYNEQELLNLSKQTGDDLTTLYINKYKDNDFAKHMGDKLRNDYKGNNAVFYISGTDGNYKFLMNKTYCKNLNGHILFKAMQFFHWISCSLSKYRIAEFFNDENITNNWEKLNNVEFFFSLILNHQELLINNYNSSYNEM